MIKHLSFFNEPKLWLQQKWHFQDKNNESEINSTKVQSWASTDCWRNYGASCANFHHHNMCHYCDFIMGAMASQITSLIIVHSTVYSGSDQRKHQSSASLAFVRRIHRWPVNSPHKWPVTQKMFQFDDVIIVCVYVMDKQLYRTISNSRQLLTSWILCQICMIYKLAKAFRINLRINHFMWIILVSPLKISATSATSRIYIAR